ncbi:DNA-3-methyladenine glycosylase [Brucella sp. BE17]|uniref:DNA-3-methyladenine glycosylase n=1 Tax=Brucella sp. BE17 TaxID=3142977 RepID=UPI0031BBBA27
MTMESPQFSEIFDRDAVEVATQLIGWTFAVGDTGGMIVETEAYTLTDPASHSFKGETKRNKSMFGLPGRAYVYRIYGLHWCMNIVCSRGSAVLIRALEPLSGLDEMKQRRQSEQEDSLCSGPAKLAQALGITGDLDGQRLDRVPFRLEPCQREMQVVRGLRIGISKATEFPWRFCLQGSAFLSRPVKAPARLKGVHPDADRLRAKS